MINIITGTKNTLSKFMDKFRDIFSNIQFKAFSTYIPGLLLQHKRASVDSIAALSPEINYQNLQYFVSESKIDIDKVNTRRVELLQRTRPTKSTSRGVLVIDDTSCKKYTIKTEGAKYQHSSAEEFLDHVKHVQGSVPGESEKEHLDGLADPTPEKKFHQWHF